MEKASNFPSEQKIINFVPQRILNFLPMFHSVKLIASKLRQQVYNHLQKTLEKLRKFRKSCNHKQNINGIYNEKLQNDCLQQLPTLRLKT